MCIIYLRVNKGFSQVVTVYCSASICIHVDVNTILCIKALQNWLLLRSNTLSTLGQEQQKVSKPPFEMDLTTSLNFNRGQPCFKQLLGLFIKNTNKMGRKEI